MQRQTTPKDGDQPSGKRKFYVCGKNFQSILGGGYIRITDYLLLKLQVDALWGFFVVVFKKDYILGSLHSMGPLIVAKLTTAKNGDSPETIY